MRHVYAGLFVACLVMSIAASASAQSFVLVSQQRSVSSVAFAQDALGSMLDSDSDQSMDFNPFNAVVSAEASVDGSAANSDAQQDSSLHFDGADFSGSAAAIGDGFESNVFSEGSGISHFSITFEVVDQTTYTLTGEISAFDLGSSEVVLVGQALGTLVDTSTFSSPQTLPIDEAGDLPPDIYTLTARAEASAFGSDFASEFASSSFLLQFRVATTACPGDADGNGITQTADLTFVISNLGAGSPGATGTPGDVNGDGRTTIDDVTFTVSNLGADCR